MALILFLAQFTTAKQQKLAYQANARKIQCHVHIFCYLKIENRKESAESSENIVKSSGAYFKQFYGRWNDGMWLELLGVGNFSMKRFIKWTGFYGFTYKVFWNKRKINFLISISFY